MTKKNKTVKKKSNRKLFLFIKSFFIAAIVFSVMVFAGWLTLQSALKPPDIPDHSNVLAAGVTEKDHKEEEKDAPAFTVPEPHTDDTRIGDGLVAPERFKHEDRKKDFYTFLIFGVDEGNNTDSIMVASYDGVNKEATVIGLPRDTKVNVKRTVKKINAAYSAGRISGGSKEAGVEQLRREIKTIIGFVPDFYISVNMNAFVRVVDAVGGITVDIPNDMVYDDPEQNLHINLQKGAQQTLTGEQALHFARYRKGNKNGTPSITDYQRIENQQAVIKAVIDKLLKPANILRIPEFVEIFTENVSTDMKLTDLPWFADQLKDLQDSGSLHTYTMPTIGTSPDGMYYELLDKDAVIQLVNDTINPYKTKIEPSDVDILAH